MVSDNKFVGPKTKKQKGDEYMKKFNAFLRGDRGGMTRNELKYFETETATAKAKKANKWADDTGAAAQRANSYAQRSASPAQTAERANEHARTTRRAPKGMPDPFAKNGKRTGSESLFQPKEDVGSWLGKIKAVNIKPSKKKKDSGSFAGRKDR